MTVSVAQVVAYNVRRIRKEQGFTQEQLAIEMREATGKGWPRNSVTMMESVWLDDWEFAKSKRRIRKLNVNQLAALANILGKQIGDFFTPPPVDPNGDPAPEKESWISCGSEDEYQFLCSETMAYMAGQEET